MYVVGNGFVLGTQKMFPKKWSGFDFQSVVAYDLRSGGQIISFAGNVQHIKAYRLNGTMVMFNHDKICFF
jgi:hypothetical protein